jgi:hypothetical protein
VFVSDFGLTPNPGYEQENRRIHYFIHAGEAEPNWRNYRKGSNEVLDSNISGYISVEYQISKRDRLNLQIPLPEIANETTITGSKNLG